MATKFDSTRHQPISDEVILLQLKLYPLQGLQLLYDQYAPMCLGILQQCRCDAPKANRLLVQLFECMYIQLPHQTLHQSLNRYLVQQTLALLRRDAGERERTRVEKNIEIFMLNARQSQ